MSKLNLDRLIANPSEIRDKVFLKKEISLDNKLYPVIYSKTDLENAGVNKDQFDKSFDLSWSLIKKVLQRGKKCR